MDEVSPSAMPSTPSPAMRASLIVEMMRHVDFARHRAADAPFALRDPSMIAEAAEVVAVAGRLSKVTGLDVAGYLQCEMLRSVNSQRLLHRLGVVGWAVMNEPSANIATLLDQ